MKEHTVCQVYEGVVGLSLITVHDFQDTTTNLTVMRRIRIPIHDTYGAEVLTDEELGNSLLDP